MSESLSQQSDLDKILALRKSYGSGGPNFVPDQTAKAWNRALVAVVVTLGLATAEECEARLKSAREADHERTMAAIRRLEGESPSASGSTGNQACECQLGLRTPLNCWSCSGPLGGGR